MKDQLEKDYADGKRVQSRIKDGEKIEGIDSKSYWRGSQTANYIARCYLEDLDEPETLSEDWIQEHSYNVHLLGTPDVTTVAVPREDLQNLLVPKESLGNSQKLEKVQIPKFVAEYLDFAKSDTTLMRVLELANTRNEWEKWEKEYDWIEENHELFARAWLDGFTIANEEKEQKYLVNILDEGTGAYLIYYPKSGNYGVTGILGDSKGITQFTEQEIKDYDERFWPFAVKVEELK